jgi:hypothetical protein
MSDSISNLNKNGVDPAVKAAASKKEHAAMKEARSGDRKVGAPKGGGVGSKGGKTIRNEWKHNEHMHHGKGATKASATLSEKHSTHKRVK